MFLLNLQGKEPIYEQIRSQILKFIELGVLSPGDKLPSVRQLAQDNGINPNTVAKAYQELEKEGYIRTLPKKGAYIAEIDTSHSRFQQLVSILHPLKESGMSKTEMLEAVEEVFKEE